MMNQTCVRALACAAAVVGFVGSATEVDAKPGVKVAITASSDDARKLYVKGRDLLERLRATDGRKLFEQAVARDPKLALGYVGLANTAGTTREFFDAVERALALVDGVSDGEQLIIRGLDAGARGDLTRQRELYGELVAGYPDDERAHMLLAGFHFGRQDYPAAITSFEAAIKIDAAFSAPYNQLGYAYRFLDRLADAERTFKKYTELLPDDPNPHDSYAELLMKTGRFDESIKSYRRALAADPNFIASYIGIANNQLFKGQPGEARTTLGKLAARARRDSERRAAITWTAIAYTHEAAWDKALAEIDKLAAQSGKSGDLGQQANDHNFAATLLLEAGRLDAAAARFKAQLAAVDKSKLPDEVKATAHRNALYSEGRIALARNDLATAKARASVYGKQVAAKANPFEVRQHHELAGRIALAERDWPTALRELSAANQLDPRTLYLTALAHDGAGDAKSARAAALKAADFNALSVTYGYVRAKAKALATKRE